MPDQPARRGRRNPALLEPDGPTGPQINLDRASLREEPEKDEETDQGFEPAVQLLYEGETAELSANIPILLEGAGRESYIGAKVHLQLQEGEPWDHLAARGHAFILASIFEQIDKTEEAIRQYEEQQAARLQQATGLRP